MVEETILGTSKIDPRYRITLVSPVPELLNVKVGDLVVFIRHKDGTNYQTIANNQGQI